MVLLFGFVIIGLDGLFLLLVGFIVIVGLFSGLVVGLFRFGFALVIFRPFSSACGLLRLFGRIVLFDIDGLFSLIIGAFGLWRLIVFGLGLYRLFIALRDLTIFVFGLSRLLLIGLFMSLFPILRLLTFLIGLRSFFFGLLAFERLFALTLAGLWCFVLLLFRRRRFVMLHFRLRLGLYGLRGRR